MKNISYSCLIRYLHANRASFFFFSIYIYILKGIYYDFYSNSKLLIWFNNLVLLFTY